MKRRKPIEKYFDRIRPVVKKVCEKHNMSLEQGEETLLFFFDSLRMFMSDPRVPAIAIPSFGFLKPSIKKINHSIRQRLRLNKGKPERKPVVRSYIKWIWEIRKRKLDKLNFINTWIKYRGKDVKEQHQKLHDEYKQESKKYQESKQVSRADDNSSK